VTGGGRLAFGGGFQLVGPAATAAVSRSAAEPPAVDDAAAERRDLVAYRALLAFTLVLFIRPQDSLRFLEPLHLAEVLGTFGIVTLIAGRFSRGAPVVKLTLEFGSVLALAGIMLATAPFSIWPGGAVSVVTDLFSKVVVVFALILNTLTTRRRFEQFVNVVVVSCSYVAVRAVLDYAMGINLVEDGRAQGAGGLFGNPNDMALNMVAFLPLAMILALSKGRPLLRGVLAIGVPALIAAIIFSKSRGGTLGLVAMVAVLLYQIRRVKPSIAVAVVAVTLVTIPLLPESFTHRMSSIFNPEEDPTGSREARKRLLREAYHAYLEHPVFGLGAGQFHNYNPTNRQETWREAHNAWLQVASELGTGGLIVFAIIVGSGFAAGLQAVKALRRAGARYRRKSREGAAFAVRREPLQMYAAAVLASLTGWVVAAMFASVAYYWTLYLVLGLAITLRDITLREVGALRASPRAARGAEAA
jgi:putative inorganic carbon (hco3(-)) transporter